MTSKVAVSPRNRYFGIMLPYAPVHHLLLDAGFTALVMTSANLSEEPIAIDNAEAAGCEELFLVPATAELAELERLSELLSKR